MPLLNSTYYIAQAYSCGAYGESSYSQCAEEESPQSSSSSQNPQSTNGNQSLQRQSGTVGQSSSSDQAQLQQTATPEQSKDFFEPSQTTGQPSQAGMSTNPLATLGFDMILLIAFLIALLIAIIFWLFKRRRREQLERFDDTTHYPPSDLNSQTK